MSQTCALTGTIYGLNDAVLANAVVVFTLMGPDNCKITATNILVDRTPLSALTNGSGVFSQNVVQNSAITPSGTYYRVTCKSANFVKYITAAGATIDVLAAADVVAADQVFSDVDDPDLYWLSFVNSQTLTAGQKLIANTNLGINLTASQLLGQASSGGTGLPVAITLGSNLSMSGTTLNASDTTGTTIADDAIWTAAGQLAYGTGTATGAVLAAGGTTDILVGGGAAAPVWTTATGSGAPVRATSPTLVTPVLGVATATSINGITMESLVAGPASATDNAIVRFDGTTGKLVQDSAVTIADTTGDITAGKYNGLTITAGGNATINTSDSGGSIDTSAGGGSINTTRDGGSIDTRDGGGSINTSGSASSGDFAGGSINTAGGAGSTGGSINTSGVGPNGGGYINTSDGGGPIDTSAAGGSIRTNDEGGYINTSNLGGYIDTQASGGIINTSNAGGNIDTSAGGGSISTRGTGSIQFGDAATRTTLVGSATAARTVTMPDADSKLPIAAYHHTFTGPTAARTITLPDANFTAARTDAAQTFTGLQTIGTGVALPDGTIGTATAAVYFTSDTDTGWYRSAANTQDFFCGGTAVLRIGYDGTNQTFGISASPLTRVVSTGEQYFAMQNTAAGHMGIRLGNGAARAYVRAAATPSTNVWVVENSAGTAQAGFDSKFGLFLTKTITSGGITGPQTIDKSSGSVNFAATDTSLVVTNDLVTTSSVIVATVATNDATMKSVAVVAGAGSFTLHANAAATAETRVNFLITN